MPLTAVATVNPTTRTVSVLVSGGTPPYNLTATPAGGSTYTVRGAWTGTSPNLTKVDAEARLNVATQYQATDAAAGAASSNIVTVAETTAVLSDALDYTQVLPVEVVSQPPNEWEGRTRTWDVLGRDDPFVSQAPLRLRTGTLVLRVTPAGRAALQSLLSDGAPLLLRSVFPLSTDDLTFAVQRVREDLVLPDSPMGDRLVSLDYQAVSRDLGTIAAGTRTYSMLLAEATNYTNVLVKFARYEDVRTGLQR
jgi:hypothetical protein